MTSFDNDDAVVISGCDVSPKTKEDKCIQNLLDQFSISSMNGILVRTCPSQITLDIAVKLMEDGFHVSDDLRTVSWNLATKGTAKMLRDETYEYVKKSLYPILRNFAKTGKYVFMFPRGGWLVEYDNLLIDGLDYFTRDGLQCVTSDNGCSIRGVSWRFSVGGVGEELRKISDYGPMNDILPYLTARFQQDPTDRIRIENVGSIKKKVLRELETRDRISFKDGAFYKMN